MTASELVSQKFAEFSEDVTVRVLLATHNRLHFTKRLIKQLEFFSNQDKVRIEIYCCDDDSIDGTRELLAASKIVKGVAAGDGGFYWAKSMSIAEKMALEGELQVGGETLILWLNDDVELAIDKLSKALGLALTHPRRIWIGAMADSGGKGTYGGYKRRGLHPLGLSHIMPSGSFQSLDTFNGNFVLYHRSVASHVGPIDGSFTHGFADIDYGFRARRKGVEIELLPEFIGVCDGNIPQAFISRREAWRSFTSVKGGGNFTSLRVLLQKETRIWLLAIGFTYALWWLRRLSRHDAYYA